jgi:NIMA (never in mitosis gene a)-related kinase
MQQHEHLHEQEREQKILAWWAARGSKRPPCIAQMAEDSRLRSAQRRSQDFSLMNTTITLETPISRPSKLDVPFSAMKGVILTETGQPLATPTPAELAKLFVKPPKVNIEFAKIFDFDDAGENSDVEDRVTGKATSTYPSSPSIRERTSFEMTASQPRPRETHHIRPLSPHRVCESRPSEDLFEEHLSKKL